MVFTGTGGGVLTPVPPLLTAYAWPVKFAVPTTFRPSVAGDAVDRETDRRCAAHHLAGLRQADDARGENFEAERGHVGGKSTRSVTTPDARGGNAAVRNRHAIISPSFVASMAWSRERPVGDRAEADFHTGAQLRKNVASPRRLCQIAISTRPEREGTHAVEVAKRASHRCRRPSMGTRWARTRARRPSRACCPCPSPTRS